MLQQLLCCEPPLSPKSGLIEPPPLSCDETDPPPKLTALPSRGRIGKLTQLSSTSLEVGNATQKRNNIIRCHDCPLVTAITFNSDNGFKCSKDSNYRKRQGLRKATTITVLMFQKR